MSWAECRRILCIRADNMGDIIMISPALKALKQSIKAHLTLLTSSQGAPICECIPEIDEVIVADMPWVKLDGHLSPDEYARLINTIRHQQFDGAIIFTVYSQSPMPAAMLAFEAGIKRRLAYCRENPYGLLTYWIPDPEPYQIIRHQVERDLALVAYIGAVPDNLRLSLTVREAVSAELKIKMRQHGIRPDKPIIVFHPGVSEEKRRYPTLYWQKLLKKTRQQFENDIIVTGSPGDQALVSEIVTSGQQGVFNLAGSLNIAELVAIVQLACIVVSVNTATVHIAAAMQTPVVVLYALTNPQHTPWQCLYRLLPFSVPIELKSRNAVIRYVDETYFNAHAHYPEPDEVCAAIKSLMKESESPGGIALQEFRMP